MDDLTIDDVLTQLRSVQLELDALPGDARTERLGLQERRRRLKIRAGKLWAASRTPDQIQRELDDLQRARCEILDRRLSVGHIGGGGGPGGGGIEIQFVNEFNRTLGERWGLSEIEQRIKELEIDVAAPERD